jgi:hypothetical protein
MAALEWLGIDAHFVFIEQRIDFEKQRKGQIDVMVAVRDRPPRFIGQIKDPAFHLVPLLCSAAIFQRYW